MTATTQRSPISAGAVRAADVVLTTGQMVWRLISYRPWLSAAYLGIWIVIHIGELAPRVMTKLFFDTLTGDQPYRFGITGIVVLVIVTRALHIITISPSAPAPSSVPDESSRSGQCYAAICWHISSTAPEPRR